MDPPQHQNERTEHLTVAPESVDSCPGSTSRWETSASWPPPSESPSLVSSLSDLMSDSSNSTYASSSSRSRLESALQASKLVGCWGTMVDTVHPEWSESVSPSTELEWWVLATLCRARDLVTLGVCETVGVGLCSAGEGTDLTGNKRLRWTVRERPLPSSCRMVNTGMEVFFFHARINGAKMTSSHKYSCDTNGDQVS